MPLVCVDLTKNKKIGLVTVKDQRLSLMPESTFLTPDGKSLFLSFVSIMQN